MNCRQAQREIALLVGEDLGDDERRENVEAHLRQCAECRRHRARVGSAISALVSAEAPATYVSVYSVWPSVRRRLGKGSPKSKPPSDWRSWTPFAGGVAACASLLLFASGAWREDARPTAPVTREMIPPYPSYSTGSPAAQSNEHGEDVVLPVSEKLRRLRNGEF
jgi:anti-sigma factor RsiW